MWWWSLKLNCKLLLPGSCSWILEWSRDTEFSRRTKVRRRNRLRRWTKHPGIGSLSPTSYLGQALQLTLPIRALHSLNDWQSVFKETRYVLIWRFGQLKSIYTQTTIKHGDWGTEMWSTLFLVVRYSGRTKLRKYDEHAYLFTNISACGILAPKRMGRSLNKYTIFFNVSINNIYFLYYKHLPVSHILIIYTGCTYMYIRCTQTIYKERLKLQCFFTNMFVLSVVTLQKCFQRVKNKQKKHSFCSEMLRVKGWNIWGQAQLRGLSRFVLYQSMLYCSLSVWQV